MQFISPVSLTRVPVSCICCTPRRSLQPGLFTFGSKINFKVLQSLQNRTPVSSRNHIPIIDECLEKAPEDFGGRSGSAMKGKSGILWFRNDLRLHDNEVLTKANEQSSTLLPLYIFDPRDYSKGGCGFGKIGPFKAQFMLESVRNLKQNLKRLGSKLIVRIGHPEKLIPSIVKRISASVVFCQEEVSKGDIKVQNAVSKALGEIGVGFKKVWNCTMHHKDDLPFKINALPATFGEFAKRIQSMTVRQPLESPNKLKSPPPKTILREEKIPNLKDLGFSDSVICNVKNQSQKYKYKGGESRALEQVKANSCQSQNIDFSSWMVIGCLSPRYLNSMMRSTHEECNQKHNLKSELEWHDFYQFSFLKNAMHSSNTPQMVST